MICLMVRTEALALMHHAEIAADQLIQSAHTQCVRTALAVSQECLYDQISWTPAFDASVCSVRCRRGWRNWL